MKRRTVNLSEEEYRDLAPFLEGETGDRRALAGAVGEEAPLYSDSAALKALALLGARALREKLLEAGYAALAGEYGASEVAAAEASLATAAEAWGE